MCKHCERLSEDKEFVHRFMELTARRLNEMATKLQGYELYGPITADDIDIRYEVNATVWKRNPLYGSGWDSRILRALEDMNK